MPHITLLALPDALASSLSLPMEMLTAADKLVQAQASQGKTARTTPLHCAVVGPTGASEIQHRHRPNS